MMAAAFFDDPEVKSTVAAINDEGRRPQTASQRPLGVAPLTATYRLQFSRNFTFADATRLVPYLKALGISHLYASPYLKARPGSTHGYDITDHNALNPEIGTEEELEALCVALREAGMGQILDFVPNHMGIGHADNAAWLDTLEWGPASPFARYFDINWRPRQPGLQGKVMVPLLGNHYGHVLERGDLKLGFDRDNGSFSIQYFEHRFPINPASYGSCLPVDASELPKHIDRADGQRLKRALIDRARDNAWLARLDRELKAINGEPGAPQSFRRLHDLLERQHYRLAYWRVAADEINYRRFFDINELAGLRIEDPDVFDAIHPLMRRLIQTGKLQGLRLDHIDGLRDPGQYLARLRDVAADTTDDFYIVVEKILARHERLREDWPIDGTTGYECINLINGLFVDPDGLHELDRTYRRFLDRSADFDEILYACKLLIIDTIMSSELHRLAGELDAISELHWSTRDYTQERLHAALREIVAGFPVYRTYVSERGVSPEDRRDIAWAVSQASKTYSGPDPEILDFIQAALTLDLADRDPAFDRATVLRFALRFQQYTGPVMAKSLEDTSFYRYNRLLSLNEVGADPRQPTVSPAAFHRMMEERAKTWPHALTTLSTHDTKRGADLRARLNVLSELASEWNQRVRRWASLNRYRRSKVEDFPAPSPNDEYAIYQTLVGAWPAELVGRADLTEAEIAPFLERIQGAVIKSIREAKRRTSWSSPRADYEGACRNFVQRLLERDRPNPFFDDFIAFQARLSRQGVLNSLSQVAIALLMPGVPDIYQGSEIWDLSMVDPDNRRPIDFAQRQEMLDGITGPTRDMLASWQDGRVKLALLHRLLQLRADHPDLFCGGSYEPIGFRGPLAVNLVGFARWQGERCCIVIASRLVTALSDAEGRYRGGEQWRGTTADLSQFPAALTDVLTGEIRPNDSPLATFLAALPVAILLAAKELHFHS
jgi:(1->4)-alpha-D-glucan 1-alpha-D-glucosylmutase